eukprot:6226239-Pyramimonas_sp.AAC.1
MRVGQSAVYDEPNLATFLPNREDADPLSAGPLELAEPPAGEVPHQARAVPSVSQQRIAVT